MLDWCNFNYRYITWRYLNATACPSDCLAFSLIDKPKGLRTESHFIAHHTFIAVSGTDSKQILNITRGKSMQSFKFIRFVFYCLSFFFRIFFFMFLSIFFYMFFPFFSVSYSILSSAYSTFILIQVLPFNVLSLSPRTAFFIALF